MHMVAIPLFDKSMTTQAYIFRFLKENNLFSAAQTLNLFDGASRSEELEIIDKVGLEAFTGGHPLFVPIEDRYLLGDLSAQCSVAPEKLIFVLENAPKQDLAYLSRIKALRDKGYRFAINYQISGSSPSALVSLCSFIFLSNRPERQQESETTLSLIKSNYRHLVPVAIHIYTPEALAGIKNKGYQLFESRLYKVPAIKAGASLPPLKLNAIRLINTVQDDNFEFDDIAKIVQSDPALTISLLKMVNARTGFQSKIKTITHAVTMLGQAEVRKWVTTAVTQSLSDEGPSEITRISLIRAKFAENLAPLFDMAHMSGELFLMGLFSVIDSMLDLPMPDALDKVVVSDTIKNALISGTGTFAPIMKLITDYEGSFWSEVSRQELVYDIKSSDLSDAYLNSLLWYKGMIEETSEEETGGEEPKDEPGSGE